MNVLNKKFLHTNPMKKKFRNRKLINEKLCMQENLSLFLCEFWQVFKNLTYKTAKLCNWELHICETPYINIQGQL
jgi:hypothetical protein